MPQKRSEIDPHPARRQDLVYDAEIIDNILGLLRHETRLVRLSDLHKCHWPYRWRSTSILHPISLHVVLVDLDRFHRLLRNRLMTVLHMVLCGRNSTNQQPMKNWQSEEGSMATHWESWQVGASPHYLGYLRKCERRDRSCVGRFGLFCIILDVHCVLCDAPLNINTPIQQEEWS